MRTLDQQRAANALARVTVLRGCSELFKRSYRSYVERLCPTVVMNGLGQALATERAAAGVNPEAQDEGQHKRMAHAVLYSNIHGWLCREPGGVFPGAADLLQQLTTEDEGPYLHAQAEALAWLQWHKKFCRAELPRGEVRDD